MRKKSWCILSIVAALIIIFGVLAFTGLQFSEKYELARIGDVLSLGLDLRGGVYTVYYAETGDRESHAFDALMDGTISVLRTRLTGQGFTEANITRQGSNYIRVEIPDVSDPQEVLDIIGTPAHLEFRDPYDNVLLEGKHIKTAAYAQIPEENKYIVVLEFNDEGAQIFEDATGRLIGQPINIYLDNDLISSPTVQEKIPGGEASIDLGNLTGAESYDMARRLSSLIMSGALPLDIEESETRAISATLGEDAISTALVAGIIGFMLICLFMIYMYRLPGLMSVMALCIYVLIVFNLLAEFKIQLTLPGIAGILLGIGMAVDANVVIFERFREELKAGRSYESAATNGYKNALRAIVDANVTTLIAAFVLMYFGTGSIKGFSYTLCLGVLISLFTAVFVTKFLLKHGLRLGFAQRWLYTR